LHISL